MLPGSSYDFDFNSGFDGGGVTSEVGFHLQALVKDAPMARNAAMKSAKVIKALMPPQEQAITNLSSTARNSYLSRLDYWKRYRSKPCVSD